MDSKNQFERSFFARLLDNSGESLSLKKTNKPKAEPPPQKEKKKRKKGTNTN